MSIGKDWTPKILNGFQSGKALVSNRAPRMPCVTTLNKQGFREDGIIGKHGKDLEDYLRECGGASSVEVAWWGVSTKRFLLCASEASELLELMLAVEFSKELGKWVLKNK